MTFNNNSPPPNYKCRNWNVKSINYFTNMMNLMKYFNLLS